MITVRRNLFFYKPNEGYLRFTENSPFKEECDHQVCNCTKAVAERPSGEPEQKQQYVSYIHKDKNYDYEVDLASPCKFTLRWPGESWDKDHKDTCHNHAYYWFKSDNNGLQIEIAKDGYGYAGCFFGHLYLGNAVDTSRFFNGHSDSRIVDLTEIGPDELWMHECGCGKEATCFFQECAESAEWQMVYEIHKRISQEVRTYAEDFVSSVERIREKVEKDVRMIEAAQYLCRWFSWVTRNLDKTEMFRCGDYCYRNSKNF